MIINPLRYMWRAKDFQVLLCSKVGQRELEGAGAGALCFEMRCNSRKVFPWHSQQAEKLCNASAFGYTGDNELLIPAVGFTEGQVPGVDPRSGSSAAGAAGDQITLLVDPTPDKNFMGPSWKTEGVCQRPQAPGKRGSSQRRHGKGRGGMRAGGGRRAGMVCVCQSALHVCMAAVTCFHPTSVN